MSKLNITVKKDGKFEFLYLKNVPVYYACVHEPRPNYAGDGKEYSLTAFLTDDQADYLLDEVKVNKQLMKVGVDKNKNRVIKYPEDTYSLVKGLNGISLTRSELTRAGAPVNMMVLDSKGKPLTDLVGNGSKVSIKLLGYRNKDGLLVVMLDTIVVLELVPFSKDSTSTKGTIVDNELGVTYTIPESKKENITPPKPSIQDEFDII